MLDVRRREFITLLGGGAFLFLCVNAAAQEGYYGADHDKWHQGFYSKLKRNDGGLCCNLMDCRPTQSRMVGDHCAQMKHGGPGRTQTPNQTVMARRARTKDVSMGHFRLHSPPVRAITGVS
jgi:hypothetical protein